MRHQAEELNRRQFLLRVAAGATLAAAPCFNFPILAQNLKDGEAPIAEPHFPSRLFLFIWRNWELANTDRMAAVLQTSQKTVVKLGLQMGLPPKPRLSEDQLRRIYITVIRQNWHVLPHEQLIKLLGWDRAVARAGRLSGIPRPEWVRMPPVATSFTNLRRGLITAVAALVAACSSGGGGSPGREAGRGSPAYAPRHFRKLLLICRRTAVSIRSGFEQHAAIVNSQTQNQALRE